MRIQLYLVLIILCPVGSNLFAEILPADPSILALTDGMDGDWFGQSLAINGDTLVVGAPYHRHSTAPPLIRGSAYVFRRSNDNWSLVGALTPSGGLGLGSFGDSVAIDGKPIVVSDTSQGSHEPLIAAGGAVYIFEESAAGWSQTATLTADDATHQDYLGASVAVSGDTVLAAAPGADAAYFFQNNGTIWQQQQKLAVSNSFGRDIALDKDLALVSSSSLDRVYAYARSATGWIQTDTLRPNLPDLHGGFGDSIDLSGNTAIIGQPYSESPGTAHIFERHGTNWTQTAKLQASDGFALDRFGSQVAISGNLAAVAATGGETGKVYLFEKQNDIWHERGHLSTGANRLTDQFGGASALNGTALAVGARLDDFVNSDSGSTYIFHVPEPGTRFLALVASSLLARRRRF